MTLTADTRIASQRILIVDDEPLVVRLCADVLTSEGYAVTSTASAAAALDLLRHEAFDLVLVDYRVSRTNAAATLERARSLNPDASTVLLTAVGTPEIVHDARALGFDDVLLKPFMPDELRQAVTTALAMEA